MKKILAFAAAALVAFGFASCKGGNNPENEAYKIEISNITATSAAITVTPADSTVTYYWDILEAAEAAKMTDEQIGTYLKEYLEEAVEYYKNYGYDDVTLADFLLTGEDSYEYTKLESNTEYAVVAIALDANGASSGKAVRKNFKTLELTEDPVPADMTFDIAVNNITFSSASVEVTPSNNEATYYWEIYPTAQIETLSDADLCAAIKDNIDYMIELYGYYGYDLSYEDFLAQGPDAYDYTGLESQTAYSVIAVAMGTLGTTNGAVAKYNFETPELVPESEENLDFHDAVIKDYRDLDGSFMIIAAPADSSVLVALNPFSDEFAGSFTKADLDLDYSGYIDYAEEKQYSIEDAEFTGVQTDNVVSYAGWFVAGNAVKYNFVFNVTLEDEVKAPAKKAAIKNAPAKKDAKLLKKVNLEKGKFVSEKAYIR